MPTPFLLIGSQLGSLNSLAYSKSHPEQVAEVVLIDPLTQSMFEENNKKPVGGDDNNHISWRMFWMKKQIPLSRFLQATALLGLNRIAILLGLLDVPGAHYFNPREESMNKEPNNEGNIEDNEKLATMRLHHFMTDPTHLGAAALELGTVPIILLL